MATLPPLDSDAEHIDVKTGRPSKDFYNWIKSLSDSIAKGFQSLVVGNPTGGNKGAGSINAESIYVNGVAVNADPFLFSDLPVIAVTTTQNIVAAHKGKAFVCQGSTAGQGFNIVIKSGGGLSQGATVTIENYSTQPWTITPASGVTLQWAPSGGTGNRQLAPFGVCTMHATFDNVWSLTGVGLT